MRQRPRATTTGAKNLPPCDAKAAGRTAAANHASSQDTPREAANAGNVTRPNAGTAARVALAVLLLLASLGASWTATRALADDSVTIVVGDQIPYAGYSTGRMNTTDGAPVICAQPRKSTPEPGRYVKKDIWHQMAIPSSYTDWRILQMRAALYYGWGSPGFDPSVWPSAWYDGSAMNADRYIVLEHILIADFHSLDAGSSLAGTNQEFQAWCKRHVIGVDDGTEYPDATRFKLTDKPAPPDTFRCYAIGGDGNDQVCLTFDVDGFLTLEKASTEPGITKGNGCYSLAGARYDVFSNAACTNKVGTLVTKDSGEADALRLPVGVYTIKEAQAPKGYKPDTKTYTASVTSGTTTRVNATVVKDEPLFDTPTIAVRKHDAQKPHVHDANAAEGDRSLEDAWFEFTHYAGDFKTAEEARESGTRTRSWTLKTDAEGMARFTKESRVSGDEFFLVSGKPALPLGTVVVREVKPSKGFKAVADTWVVNLKANGNSTALETAYAEPIVAEPGVAGGVELIKVDADSGTFASQGGAQLGGTFQIINRSAHEVTVKGRTCAPGEVAFEGTTRMTNQGLAFTTDEDGDGVDRTLPFGSYEIVEHEAKKGYLTSDEIIAFKIKEDGRVIKAARSFANNVKRGGLAFEKHDEQLGRPWPQGDAKLDATFQIITRNDSPVWVQGKEHQKGSCVYQSKAKQTKDGYRFETPPALLPYGHYTLVESIAAHGCLPSDVTFDFTIDEHERFVTIGDGTYEDSVIRGGVRMLKLDSNSGRSAPQGDSSLDAAFRIINESDHPVVVNGKEFASGEACYEGRSRKTDDGFVFTTDADGDGTDRTLPFGTYSIEETEASLGCLKSEDRARFTISEDGAVVNIDPRKAIDNEPIRGGVAFEKLDLESLTPKPLGAGALDATFQITNLSPEHVLVEGMWIEPGEVACTVTAAREEDGGWRVRTSDTLLPYGTYSIKETGSGLGYHSDPKEVTFTIREHKRVVELPSLDGPGAAATFANQVRRGDLSFVKVRETDMARLAGIPFAITSQTTGERHVVVTDENGCINTAAKWNPHTQRTNANDQLAENGSAGVPAGDAGNGHAVEDGGSPDPEAGIWFGKTQDGGTTTPDDELGALPYDRYTLEELRCDNNQGLQLLTVKDVFVSRSDVTIDLGTFDDPPESESRLDSRACDARTLGKTIAPQPDARVIEEVEHTGLAVGEPCVLVSWLIDSETGQVVPGTEKRKEFTPSSPDGVVRSTIEFDAQGWQGKRLVVCDRLERDGETLLEHIDPDDFDQSVIIGHVALKTKARNGQDGSETLRPSSNAQVVDQVDFKSLVPGQSYRLEGKLVAVLDDDAQAPNEGGTFDAVAAEDAGAGSGETVPGSPTEPTEPQGIPSGTVLLAASLQEFTPDKPDGSVDVRFRFDASRSAGTKVACLERLWLGNQLIAEHWDKDDPSQTLPVERPTVRTTAADKQDGDQVLDANAEACVIDTVAHTGLEPGSAYRLEARLMLVAEDGGVDTEPVASQEMAFTPQASSGSVDVELPFDASSLASGSKLVVFERLFTDAGPSDEPIAAHEDPQDEGQSVTIVRPSIGTHAKGDLSDGAEVGLSERAQVVDTVRYAGLKPGVEHVLKGRLMLRSDQSEDGLRQIASAEAAFTPESPEGTVELTFTFDSRSLHDGDRLVAFEQAWKDQTVIARHEDPDDPEQTVVVRAPAIDTLARAAGGGHGEDDGHEPERAGETKEPDEGAPSKRLAASRNARAVDQVAYAGLVPGASYELATSLMFKGADGKNAEAFEPVPVGSVRFVAESETGTIDVPFAFDALDALRTSYEAGGTGLTVIAQELWQNGEMVAVHADVDNSKQTLDLPAPSMSSQATDERDGDQVLTPSTKTTVQDTVTVNGVVPGADSTATLVTLLMDEQTGAPYAPSSAQTSVEDRIAWYEDLMKKMGMEKTDASWASTGDVESHALDHLEGSHPGIAKAVAAQATPLELSADGTMTHVVKLATDTSELPDGARLCVFQFLVLSEEGASCVIASETDHGNESQTVTVARPKIASELVDAASGTHQASSDKALLLQDTVTFEGLPSSSNDAEMMLRGILVDRETGKAIQVDGKEIVSSAALPKDTANGSITMDYRFDASRVAAKEVTAYVYCQQDSDGDPLTLASHENREDGTQTVTLNTPGAPAQPVPAIPFDKTGSSIAGLLSAALLLLAAGGALLARNRRLARRRPGAKRAWARSRGIARKNAGGKVPSNGGMRLRRFIPGMACALGLTGLMLMGAWGWMAASANPDGSGNHVLAGLAQAWLPEEGLELSSENGLSDSIDWSHWKEVNPDIVGWVRVPGTRIDHPVVAAPTDDPQRYLTHDVYGRPNLYGAPYLAANCRGDPRLPSALVFGHHMNDGSMFSDFSRFIDAEYAKAHARIEFATPEGTRNLFVKCVDVVDASSTGMPRTFLDSAAFASWYTERLSTACVVLDDALPRSSVMTFCTCSYTAFDNERTLVVASDGMEPLPFLGSAQTQT